MNLSNTQWAIITELSSRDKTPSELAKKLNLSLPSIHFQLKQLESEQLIYKEERKSGKTRPFTVYSLREGFLSITQAIPGEVRKVHLNADEEIKLHLRIWSIPQKKYHYFIESYWWKLEKYVENIEAMGIYGSVARGNAKDGSDIDILLLIKDKQKIKKYTKEIGVKDVGAAGSS
ncbi:MAG: nucleotidyltransferase domain-containing protein, partial [Nanoarchaeota archaeon]